MRLLAQQVGTTIARHNNVRDLVAALIGEAGIVDVETEPRHLPCDGLDLPGSRSLNISDEAWLDVRARGFWSREQDAFLMYGYLIPRHPCGRDQKP